MVHAIRPPSRLRCIILVVCGSILSVPVALRAQVPPNPPVLHALLVIDTDSNLANSVVKDRDNVNRVLMEGFATRPHRLELKVFEGENSRREKVLDYYSGLRVKSTDTLLLYYSGHGATLQGKGHCLTMHHDRAAGDYLTRSELRTAMQRLEPRLSVLLTDCCSKVSTRRGPDVPTPPPATWPVMDLLFFNHKGVADVNGCQADAFSWCYSDNNGDQGGTFTLALVPLLCTKKVDFSEVFGAQDGFVKWDDFAKRLQQDTDEWYQRIRPNVGGTQESQDPELVELGKKAPQPDVRDNIWLFGARLGNGRLGDRRVAVVEEVKDNTPAAKAGLKREDAILSIDGVATEAKEDVYREIERSSGRITVKFWSDGKTSEKDVELTRVKPAP